jgi:hypothetical protein
MESKYFDQREFACPCCGQAKMNEVLIEMLDEAREFAGVPFNVTSGFRCAIHNERVGGKRTSAHKFGLAVDISAGTSRQRYKILKGLILAGFERIGIDKHFIHADVDGTKDPEVTWMY